MSLLSRCSFALLSSGIVLVALISWTNRPSVWRPLVTAADTAKEVPAPLSEATEYEISLEAGESTPRQERQALTAFEDQTLVDGQWRVRCSSRQLAAGGTSEYLRVLPVRSVAGKLRRVLGRVPFGQDERSYATFGLAGEFLAERVVGRLFVPEGHADRCLLEWEPISTGLPVRLVIRASYGEWRSHYRQTAFFAFAGELLFVCGLLSALAAFMQRRIQRHRG